METLAPKIWDKEKVIITGVVGKRQSIVFKSKEDLRGKIKETTVSCGCTKPNYNRKTRELVVVYTPKKMPSYLKGNSYLTNKVIQITLTDGRVYKLVIAAEIFKDGVPI